MIRSFAHILLRPSHVFTRMRGHDLLSLAIFLQLFRWHATAFTTMVSLYQERSPMLLPTPFGIDANTYRMVEIFAYGPYGLLVITGIARILYVYGRDHATIGVMTLGKTWELVGICFFAPWLPSLVIDSILIKLGWGGPMVIIPWHLFILTIEGALVAVGLNAVFGIPLAKATRLGIAAGFTFLVLAGILIR